VKDLRTAAGETALTTTFADKTSSIVVVMGTWFVYEDANFLENERELKPGRYPDVVKAGIHNERISSLRPKKATSSPSPPPGSPPPGSPPPGSPPCRKSSFAVSRNGDLLRQPAT
jgi:Beta/Gamma crystallin